MATPALPAPAPVRAPAARPRPSALPPSPATVFCARRALVAAGATGVVGDLLLRAGLQGVAVPLFVLAVLVALAAVTRARRAGWTLGACLLIAPTLFFALAFAWRASGTLALFNLAALLVALAALATSLARGEEWEPASELSAYLRVAGWTAGQVAGGSADMLFREGQLSELGSRDRVRAAGSIARGTLVAIPVLLLFGSLLASADPVFDRLLGDLFDVDLAALVSHGVLFVGCAWLAGGYLRSTFAPRLQTGERARDARPAVGATEAAIVVGLLDVMFLGFVVVQLRYLFGGAAHVLRSAGLTYAEYARAGFFELVWVAALALPTLLVAHGFVRRGGARWERSFRVLAGVMIASLVVIMLSAAYRMRLYQREYGLTETRLYASAAMAWLALVFVWFAATVLRGRVAPFAFGTLLSAWAVVAALDVTNPDALIARTNLARLERGQRFDASYVASLGPDAAPVLAPAVVGLPGEGRCEVVRSLLAGLDADADWRGWSLARWRGRSAVSARAESWRGLGCAGGGRPLAPDSVAAQPRR